MLPSLHPLNHEEKGRRPFVPESTANDWKKIFTISAA